MVLFCPILDFGAFAQGDGIKLVNQSFGMLGERAQEGRLRSFRTSISCFGGQENVVSVIVEFGRRKTTSRIQGALFEKTERQRPAHGVVELSFRRMGSSFRVCAF